MDDISNRTLALLLVTAIVVSLGATVYTLNYLGRFRGLGVPTGRAPTDYGNVTLTVSNQVSILLTTSLIDFGTGFVNTSCDFINTGTAYNYSNITAASSFLDTTDCWTGTPSAGTSLVLENNGNLNASVAMNGPDNATFFNNYNGLYPDDYRVAIRSRNSEASSCDTGLQSTWALLSENNTVCADLLWDDPDEIAIDVNLWIPKDITSGTYNASVVEFYAVQS